jgi:methionyl-tRNA formyltransferase
MKIIFIGTVEFSRYTLSKLIELNAEIAGVITKRTSSFHSDFSNVADVAEQSRIPLYFTQDINQAECVQWIKNKTPDVIICFGWSGLIKEPLLSLTTLGVIGFHPALLPRNRGRHPIIWALALGLEETGSTFFFIDEGVDSGDILSQERIPIHYGDNARTLYTKITNTALAQIENFFPALEQNTYKRLPQDHHKASYWRKRTNRDGLIDWRMSARGIYNVVRALTRPYAGAYTLYHSQECKIWAVAEVNENYPNNIEPGKVIAVDTTDKTFTVKCYHGALQVIKHDFNHLPAVGEYL